MARRESLRRRRPSRKPKPRFLLVCEGQVTEPCYFRELRHLMRSLIELELLPGGDPKALVERAVQKRAESKVLARREGDSYLAYDQVWCVFDVDQHERLNDALQQARDNKVSVAASNPCFELWALLHFQDQTAFIERGKVQSLCRSYMPQFDKKLPCAKLLDRYQEAKERALKLEQLNLSQNKVGANPSTGVHHLIQEIELQSQA